MARVLPLMIALSACSDTGSIQVPVTTDDGVSGDAVVDTDAGGGGGGGGGGHRDTDGASGASDSDAQDTGGAAGGGGTTTTCGPTLAPPSAALGAPSVASSGHASIAQLIPGVGDHNWKGCEVEHRFDASGVETCVVWRTVRGTGPQTWGAASTFDFDLTFVVDRLRTTCAGASDLAARYRVEASVLSSQLALSRAPASGGAFTLFDRTPYRGNFTGIGGISFSYRTPLEAP